MSHSTHEWMSAISFLPEQQFPASANEAHPAQPIAPPVSDNLQKDTRRAALVFMVTYPFVADKPCGSRDASDLPSQHTNRDFFRCHNLTTPPVLPLAQAEMLSGVKVSPLPHLSRFLHDPTHPATSWLLWAQSPESSSSSTEDMMSSSSYKSSSIRGMMHHAVSFGTDFASGNNDDHTSDSENVVPADIFYVCQHELSSQISPEVKISLGCFFGGMHQIQGITDDLRNSTINDSSFPSALVPSDMDNCHGHGKSDSSKDTTLCSISRETDTDKAEHNSIAKDLAAAKVPVGGRFATVMGPDGVFIISVVRLSRQFTAMQLFYPHGYSKAPRLDGVQINSSAHVVYDASGMSNGALPLSCRVVSETITLLHDECPVCDMPLEHCPCETARQFGSQCSSFRKLSERLRDGTASWRRSSGRTEVVKIGPSAPSSGSSNNNVRIRIPLFLDLRDGFSSNSHTSKLRLRFFDRSGMSVSSPYLLLPAPNSSARSQDAGEFHCPQCPKKFRLQAGLRRHKRTVHGPRRYECTECLAKFQQATHLQTHRILIHLRTLNFACNFCAMRFPIRARLTAHERNVHGQRPSRSLGRRERQSELVTALNQ